VSAVGTWTFGLSILKRNRKSVPSATVNGWSSQTTHWMSFNRNTSGV
jgi:hypothetical protein